MRSGFGPGSRSLSLALSLSLLSTGLMPACSARPLRSAEPRIVYADELPTPAPGATSSADGRSSVPASRAPAHELPARVTSPGDRTLTSQAAQSPGVAPAGSSSSEQRSSPDSAISPSDGSSADPRRQGVSGRKRLPDREEVIRDALVHAVLALDSYNAGDLPSVQKELEVALDTLLAAELPSGEDGLRLLQGRLPAGYAAYELMAVHQEAVRSKQAAQAPLVPAGEGSDTDQDVGGPQGLGILQTQSEGDGGSLEPAVSASAPSGAAAAPPTSAHLSPEDMLYVRGEIARIVAAFGEKEYPHVEVFEDQVAYFIKSYQTNLREFFERSLLRSIKYMPMVQEVLREKGVPEVMSYIAFVESGFRPWAVSSAGAVGVWQFMPKTARAYGLRVDGTLDERLDPDKATVAAREYFLDLVAIFGSSSFLLAIASYNAGEGKVQYCLKQVEDPFTQRTFWDIRSCLRQETREYIPRIIAAAITAQAPERFGFKEAARFLDPELYEVVAVPQPTSLALLSTLAGVSLSELRDLNPDLKPKETITPHPGIYRLLVPRGSRENIEAELQIIASRKKETGVGGGSRSGDTASERVAQVPERTPPDKPATGPGTTSGDAGKGAAGSTGDSETRTGQEKNVSSSDASAQGSGKAGGTATGTGTKVAEKNAPAAEASPRPRYIKYEVQAGNSIAQIASDFGKTQDALRGWNPYLKKRNVQPGDIVHIYDLDPSFKQLSHKVGKGDTLGSIARRYQTSPEEIQHWNGLSSDTVALGSRLIVYATVKEDAPPTASKKTSPDKTPAKQKPIVYTVQPGNSLSVISLMFDVSAREIMEWNKLKKATIFAGQDLKIYPGRQVQSEKYTVKKGDTLQRIASRYKLEESFVRATNGLGTSAQLKKGQVLILYRRAE